MYIHIVRGRKEINSFNTYISSCFVTIVEIISIEINSIDTVEILVLTKIINP